LLKVLRTWAAVDVRCDAKYIWFYMVMGATWVGLAKTVLPLVGISARDDVLERGNRAAALAIAGALLGLTLCFAGGNIGDGPGWWVVVFSAAIATGAHFLLWRMLDQFTGMSEKITVDRDVAAGLRAAGFFIGIGLILGRAVAGNWISAAATFADFARYAWYAVLLAAVVAFGERMARPVTDRDMSSTLTVGVVPGLLYVWLGYMAVVRMGEW
jgi:uncharacterized membrane protein YjfL (UPF0719 family)